MNFALKLVSLFCATLMVVGNSNNESSQFSLPFEPVLTDLTLDSDKSGKPLVIGADDVTIDCQGYTIQVGQPAFGFPSVIQVNQWQRVTIKNCVVDATGLPPPVAPVLFGIRVESANVKLVDVTIRNAQLNGLDVNDNSNVQLSGDFVAEDNGLFGVIILNGCNVKLSDGIMTLQNNQAGLQVSLSSTLFLDATTQAELHAINNVLFGLTVVSKSELFTFEAARIIADGNIGNGCTVFSKALIEIDRDGTLTCSNNGGIGVWIEDSTVNMFTINQDAPSLSSVSNGLQGLLMKKNGIFDTNNLSTVVITNNGSADETVADIEVEDGSTAFFKDADLGSTKVTFGARAEFVNSEPSSLFCDRTVWIREDGRLSNKSCNRSQN